jgi:choline dehydrogenase-like flavoprotein
MICLQLSRGTILLNTTNKYADPIVDFNTFVNPIDMALLVEDRHFLRRYLQTPSMQSLTPVEVAPAANVTTDEHLAAATRQMSGSGTGHFSGTCAMMPRELGGVVAHNLLVYGVTGLSVADDSSMPLIPGAHTCATVYAIAEKVRERPPSCLNRCLQAHNQAADLIKARHSIRK